MVDTIKGKVGSIFVSSVVLLLAAMVALLMSNPAYGAGLVVNSTADTVANDGACTLREAITAANTDTASGAALGECPAGSGADTITFSITGIIPLGSELPAISNNLTITGPSAASLTISGDSDNDGDGDVPILTVNFGAIFTLEMVTVSKGFRAGIGGGIYNVGTLTVANSTFSGNRSTVGGGGIYNGGTLTVTNSTFSGNSAGNQGGGILNDSTLTVTNSTFSGNNAPSGGGIINFRTLTVTNSTFSGNNAPVGGGGGGILNYGALTVANSTFSNNSSGGGGGGILHYSEGAFTLKVANSTFSGNSATSGGGIFIVSSGAVTVANSIFSGNRAISDGGGISNNRSPLTVTNSTFSGNSATFGGGIYGNITSTLRNTIVANSSIGGNCFGIAITDGGGNLRWPNTDTSCVGTFGDPMLGSLANNGGPTETMALLLGSAAINTAIDAICAAAVGSPGFGAGGLDQRGVVRPQGAHCDIGAFELEAPANTPPTADAGGPYSGDEGSPIEITGIASDPDLDSLMYAWSYVAVSGVDAGATCDFVDENALSTDVTCTDDGTYKLTLTVDDGVNPAVSSNATLTVANVAPDMSIATPLADALFPLGTVQLTVPLTDDGTNDTHTCTVNWDDLAGAIGGTVAETSGSGDCSSSKLFTIAGVYTITVEVTDDDGNSDTETVMIIVYDPSAGFVTGGGWINSPSGAYKVDLTLAGKANFGFVSKYKKGASTPTGETEFQFQAGSFNFHSAEYQWLVVAGCKAQYKGTGTVNGVTGYGFLLTATDGNICAAKTADKFRIKVWDTDTDTIVYDNVGGSDDIDAANPQDINGGSIVIHKN